MTLSYEGADRDLPALVCEATHHPPTADPTERSFFCVLQGIMGTKNMGKDSIWGKIDQTSEQNWEQKYGKDETREELMFKGSK